MPIRAYPVYAVYGCVCLCLYELLTSGSRKQPTTAAAPTGNWVAIRPGSLPCQVIIRPAHAERQTGRAREKERKGEENGRRTRKLSKQDDGAAAEAEQVVAASAGRNHIMWQLQRRQRRQNDIASQQAETCANTGIHLQPSKVKNSNQGTARQRHAAS